MTFETVAWISFAYFMIKSKGNCSKVLHLLIIPAGAVALVCWTLYHYCGTNPEQTFGDLLALAKTVTPETDMESVGGMQLVCGTMYYVATGAAYAFAAGWIWAKVKGLFKSAEKAIDKIDSHYVTTETHSYLPSGEEYFPDDIQ